MVVPAFKGPGKEEEEDHPDKVNEKKKIIREFLEYEEMVEKVPNYLAGGVNHVQSQESVCQNQARVPGPSYKVMISFLDPDAVGVPGHQDMERVDVACNKAGK